MSGIICAFKSSHPTVLAAYEDNNRRYCEWRDAMWAFVDNNHPRFKPFAVTYFRGAECYFRGLSSDGYGTSEDPETRWRNPGPLWRLTDDCWVPSRRSKAGKELAEQVEAIKVTGLKHLPGMPDAGFLDNCWYSPGQKFIDGIVWITWGCPAEAVEGSEWSKASLDRELWTETKLSEYYLAVEESVNEEE